MKNNNDYTTTRDIKGTSKGELILDTITFLDSLSKDGEKNVVHLTIHPEVSLLPNQLLFKIRTEVLSKLMKQSAVRNETLVALIVIEFGRDITNENKIEINRLGTHAHVLLSTSFSPKFIEEKSKQFFDGVASVQANQIDKFFDKTYWIKDYERFGDITFWANGKSIDHNKVRIK